MDPYEFLLALYFDLYLSVSADRVVQLRDLIVLWIIRIEIILTVKFTVLCDCTVGCKTDSNCFFYYPFIQYRYAGFPSGVEPSGGGICDGSGNCHKLQYYPVL